MIERETVTLGYLQKYIWEKDHGGTAQDYFFKLSEEVGELAQAMRKQRLAQSDGELKGSIQEELWDVIYYALCIANGYEIDLSHWIPLKEALNHEKYHYPDTLRYRPGEERAK